MNENQFIIDWKQKGDKETNETYRFFCYFIAFNWFYNKYEGKEEYTRIKNCIQNYVINNDKYNPIVFLKSNEWKRLVCDSRSGIIKKYILEEENQVIRLFLSIYQIRCNLFHGSKWMCSKRDTQLVKESADVLQDFLQRQIFEKSR